MKDLFSGAFGKLNNHGGSRMFTTPNTRKVTPEYEITTNIPSIAEFITCSLDGRLWVFRRSRRYYIAVFKWDDFTQKFGFIHSIALNNTNFIARGVDWLLTDNTIVQASDDEPYVFTANLFDDDGESFFYSFLRSKVLSSGIDPITKAVWGVSDNNGNSEGYGYFKRSALLESVNKHYSMLPAVGDWHIIKNFLVRKADNPLTEAHNSMLNIRPLIPLEFNGSTPAYGCGYDNDIFLTYYNGELWGRGLYHIGRCYILPAVFDESGNPQEFYLYISPDYPRINVAQAEKLNLGILKTADNVYGFSISQANSLDSGLCFASDSPKIFEPSAKQWQEFSQSGQMFIDTLNHSGLVLNDDGAIFLNGASYECKGLKQWLAPAGVIEAVSEQSVISSFDNAALATYPQQGFHRELLTGKKLPISAKAYSGKRLSLGLNGKTIQANSIAGGEDTSAIAWENIYKQPYDIKFLNSFLAEERVSFFNSYPIVVIESKGHTVEAVYDLWWYDEPPPEEYDGTSNSPLVLSMTITTKIMWINPETGTPEYSTVSTSFNNHIPIDNRWWTWDMDTGERALDHYDPWYYAWGEPGTDVKTAPSFGIQDNKIGFYYAHYTYESINSDNPYSEGYEYDFVPCDDISYTIEGWTDNILSPKNDLYFDGFMTPYDTQNLGLIIRFREKNSNTKFLYHVKTNLNPNNIRIDNYRAYFNNSHNSVFTDTEGNTIPIEKLHIITLYDSSSNRFPVLIFKSRFHPEIFDFTSEVERSKLS